MSLAEQWLEGHKHHSADAAMRIQNARRCLSIVSDQIPFKSVIDFGCGIGAWLHAATDLGAEKVIGIEGDYIRNADTVVPQSLIETRDLATFETDWNKKFDVAMTIEVAEHLPEAAANGFVRMLTSASDVVIFSAARLNQTGLGHINEQPLGYWISKFDLLRYVPLEIFRPHLANVEGMYPWLRMNLIMLVQSKKLEELPHLHQFSKPLADFDKLWPG
ncbi:methyltransferase domain-containing protein [Rhodopseudomonas palustris]|uniref:Methyltransferase domain-containing protein n=1 Tax=Rhodopseudomonas palustris TaxID=1076 RepID=A0A418VR51_RHOPL|nr:methyltransferase domain-containing protein [Rhodopseudomonas palustris]RJF78767.1 methyltransferase domain-containing protein [Rhodopseudomonas palustris]